MADEEDDLDAFFEEVSEVEAKVVQEEHDGDGDEALEEASSKWEAEKASSSDEPAPPAKRQKTISAVRPRGVVVASSTSVVLPVKEREEKAAEAESKAQQQHQQQYHQNQRLPPHHGHSSMRPMGPMGSHLGPSPMGASIGPAFPPGIPMPNGSNNPHVGVVIGIGASIPASIGDNQSQKKKPIVRIAAGQKWVDPSLEEWPENDYRIFVGNLSNEVTDVQLYQHFSKYPSLAKARVVRHNNNPDKSKGYGFVSLLDPLECARALREMDQTWLCSRPIRVKRSDWKERDFKEVKKKQKKEMKQQKRMGLKL